MKNKIFVSYHFVAKDSRINGFGNWIGEFNMEEYKDDLASFILDAQREIENLLKDKLKMEVAVKVIYFR